MSSRREELLAAYLDGSISDADASELLDLLRNDPAGLEQLRKGMILDEALRQELSFTASKEGIARAVVERLKASVNDTDFARRVVVRINQDKGRGRSRRFRRGPSPSTGPWTLLLGAAAVLLFVLFVTLSSTRKKEDLVSVPKPIPEEPRVEAPRPEPAPPAPPVPVPPSKRPDVAPVPPPAPTSLPPSVPAPKEPPSPTPPPSAPSPPPTTVAEAPAATIEELEGENSLLSGGKRVACASGTPVPTGSGLDCRGSVTIAYADGTRVAVKGPAKLDNIRAETPKEGKSFRVDSGAVSLVVTPQPEARPMTISSPHGSVEVLGTFLRVTVENASTGVEVFHGKVRAARTDGASAIVRSGLMASLTPSSPPVARPLALPKSPAPFASLWVAENPSKTWRGVVDGRNKSLLLSGSAPENREETAAVWAVGSWNLVHGTVGAAMDVTLDPKPAEETASRHSIVLRFVEARDKEGDQGVEVAVFDSGMVEVRVDGGKRNLGSVSVKDLLKARRAVSLEVELTEKTVRVTASGRPVFSGPHLLDGYGIVRVGLSDSIPAGGAYSDRIVNPRIVFLPSGK